MRFRRVIRGPAGDVAGCGTGWAQQAAAPPDFDSLLAQAMRLHQAGDLMGAIDAYQAALRIDPNRGDARSNLGAAYVRLGRFGEAIEQYQQALRVAPDDLAIQFNLALAYYKAVQFADAVPLLERVVAAPGGNPARCCCWPIRSSSREKSSASSTCSSPAPPVSRQPRLWLPAWHRARAHRASAIAARSTWTASSRPASRPRRTC